MILLEISGQKNAFSSASERYSLQVLEITMCAVGKSRKIASSLGRQENSCSSL